MASSRSHWSADSDTPSTDWSTGSTPSAGWLSVTTLTGKLEDVVAQLELDGHPGQAVAHARHAHHQVATVGVGAVEAQRVHHLRPARRIMLRAYLRSPSSARKVSYLPWNRIGRYALSGGPNEGSPLGYSRPRRAAGAAPPGGAGARWARRRTASRRRARRAAGRPAAVRGQP